LHFLGVLGVLAVRISFRVALSRFFYIWMNIRLGCDILRSWWNHNN
jgi:hypothetical protein